MANLFKNAHSSVDFPPKSRSKTEKGSLEHPFLMTTFRPTQANKKQILNTKKADDRVYFPDRLLLVIQFF